MENRDLARLLGALCLEERLRIIGGLISAGHEGLSLHELSQITGLDLKIADRDSCIFLRLKLRDEDSPQSFLSSLATLLPGFCARYSRAV